MEVREPQGGPGIRILRSPSLAKIRGQVCGTTKVILKKKNQTTERLLLIWVPWALRNAFLFRLLLLPLSLTNVWLTPSSSCGRGLELKCL